MDCFGWFWAFLAPEIFFIWLLVFSLKRLENPQNRIFSKKADFFKKSNHEDLQALLEKKKTKSPMTKIARTRNAQNYPNNSFFVLRSW